MKNSFETTVERMELLSPEYSSQKYIEEYIKPHMRRFQITLGMLQEVCAPRIRVIDVGSYGSLVPALQQILGLIHIVITTPPQTRANQPARKPFWQTLGMGNQFRFHVDRFDLEGSFPYRDETFDIVIFTEVLEHISLDPMHVLCEINRITKTGGWILLSTPNCASAKSVMKILRGGNPNCYPCVYEATESGSPLSRVHAVGSASIADGLRLRNNRL